MRGRIHRPRENEKKRAHIKTFFFASTCSHVFFAYTMYSFCFQSIAQFIGEFKARKTVTTLFTFRFLSAVQV